MKKSVLALLLIVFASNFTNAQDKPTFTTNWDKGFNVNSTDGNFKLKFGGRIQEHWSFFGQDDALDSVFGKLNDRSEFRRIRFYNAGTIYKSVSYKLEMDFANGRATVTDGYITVGDLPGVGNVQFGHFKEPFSLDMMNSSNDMTFMERSPATIFKKQRNNGLLLFNTALKNRATWAVGVYQNTDAFGKSIDEKRYHFTGRITGLPYYDKANKRLLHLGAAYSYRHPSMSEFSAKANPEANLSHTYVNTGDIKDVKTRTMAGGELALVLNSFSLQSEYIATTVNAKAGDYNFSGYYVETGFFLTGESKNYSDEVGFFKRVSPEKNFNPKGENRGYGALELAMRYSHLDLDDKDILGGTLNDVTAALNWYLNPATRFSLNYTLAHLNNVGNNNIVQMKFQLAF